MTESAFMVVPIEPPDPSGPLFPGSGTAIPPHGGPGPRAADAAVPLAELESRIRARLDSGEVEFLAGIDAWTVRLPGAHSAASLRRKLAGLPVEVADDQPFFAI